MVYLYKLYLKLLNTHYSASDFADKNVTVVNETKELLAHEEITKNFINDSNVNFCFEGYDQSKRYININLFDNRDDYWKLIYEYKINNILLLEDRFNEKLVSL